MVTTLVRLQWDVRELRALVLASLGAQYFLVLFAGVRKFHIPPWLKVSFRLAHICSDALAIFALAKIFDHQRQRPLHGNEYVTISILKLFWAPLVLMHLGGQVVITSYKIEDNEEWSRHILISLSKVTIGLYLFHKSSGWIQKNKQRLFAAILLLFILEIIRCFQKVLDLKSSSFNALRKAISKTSVVRGINVTVEGGLDNLINKAREVVNRGGPCKSMDLPSLPYHLFLDSPFLDSDRVEILNKFWSLDPKSAYRAVEGTLSAMSSFLYTKDESTPYLGFSNSSASVIFRRCTQLLAYATLITAICLVHSTSHPEFHSLEDDTFIAVSKQDIWTTYVMLYGTVLLEVVHFCVKYAFRNKFSGRIFQHSIIGLLAHNKRHSMLRKIAGWLQCGDFLDDCWHMQPSDSCKEITELVRGHIETRWKEDIVDTESYRRFNDARGERTLAKNGYFRLVGWSIQRPFDESIILWHLATDLLFVHHKAVSPGDRYRARRCKEMSNYMMHLLFENPEMLMPGSRKSLFTTAYDELEEILKGEEIPRDKMRFTQKVIEKCKAGSIPNSFIRDAWLLVVSFQGHIHEKTTMWEVIQGVWVEMLCFSAGRCRGYLHAEALGTSVEYLSYVWVLLAHAGMETFPEKFHRRDDVSFDSDEP